MELILVQYDIQWENRAANFATIHNLLKEAQPNSLIVLPELFSTGFSMDLDKVAEADPSEAEHFITELAIRFKSTVIGGLATRAPGASLGRNEWLAVGPSGQPLARYQKNHTFSYTGESDYYQRGDEIALFDWAGFTVCPFICYDLRFPELFRQGVKAGANLFPVIANWPVARVDHWTTLLRARAIENQAVVAGVNRIGSDPKFVYPGRSMIVDHQGKTLAEAQNEATIIRARPDLEELKNWRSEFPALLDARI
jgi:omega-amidase